jgi:hypothetical protein
MDEAVKVHDIDYLSCLSEEAATERKTDIALHYIEKVLQTNPKHAGAWNIR